MKSMVTLLALILGGFWTISGEYSRAIERARLVEAVRTLSVVARDIDARAAGREILPARANFPVVPLPNWTLAWDGTRGSLSATRSDATSQAYKLEYRRRRGWDWCWVVYGRDGAAPEDTPIPAEAFCHAG